MSENPGSLYHSLNSTLKSEHIGLTASEIHGLISGLLAGGNHDETWFVLLTDFANNGKAFSESLKNQVTTLYQRTADSLKNGQFDFQLLLCDDESLFAQIDDLIGWVNHFLLGLGLMQPKLDKLKGDVAETISDLRQIVNLGYDEDDDQEELARSFEEIAEYVRVATMLCYEEWATHTDPAPSVH